MHHRVCNFLSAGRLGTWGKTILLTIYGFLPPPLFFYLRSFFFFRLAPWAFGASGPRPHPDGVRPNATRANPPTPSQWAKGLFVDPFGISVFFPQA